MSFETRLRLSPSGFAQSLLRMSEISIPAHPEEEVALSLSKRQLRLEGRMP